MKKPKHRHDGWTLPRRTRFLARLREGDTIKQAAAAVGMSRESAHRLRSRLSATAFAADWIAAIEGSLEAQSNAVDLWSRANIAGYAELYPEQERTAERVGSPRRDVTFAPSKAAVGDPQPGVTFAEREWREKATRRHLARVTFAVHAAPAN